MPRPASPDITVSPRRGSRARWLQSVLGLALIGTAAWSVTHSRIFDLRSLRVSGNVHLSSAQVATIGGLGSRTNVLWLSTGGLERRLESNPWIRDARISRTLPSGISIVVVERKPAAILAGSGLVVSGDGVILGPGGEEANLPAIGGGIGRIGPDTSRLPFDLPSLQMVRSLPPALAPLVARIGSDPSRGLILTLQGGTPVFLGDADRAPAKTTALLAMLRWIDRYAVRPAYIDLTVPTAPALLPERTGPSPSGS
jgi:cell division protein FtsQ